MKRHLIFLIIVGVLFVNVGLFRFVKMKKTERIQIWTSILIWLIILYGNPNSSLAKSGFFAEGFTPRNPSAPRERNVDPERSFNRKITQNNEPEKPNGSGGSGGSDGSDDNSSPTESIPRKTENTENVWLNWMKKDIEQSNSSDSESDSESESESDSERDSIKFKEQFSLTLSIKAHNGETVILSQSQIRNKGYHFDALNIKLPPSFDIEYAKRLPYLERLKYLENRENLPDNVIYKAQLELLKFFRAEKTIPHSGNLGSSKIPGTVYINEQTRRVAFVNANNKECRTWVKMSKTQIDFLKNNNYHIFPRAGQNN